MRFIIFLGRFFSSVLLSAAIFLFIFAINFTFLIGNKQVIKDTLHESGVYSELIPVVIESIEISSSEDEDSGHNVIVSDQDEFSGSNKEESFDFNDPEIKDIAVNAIPPELLQEQFEGFIDSVFKWLESDGKLTFVIDLNEAKQNFVEGAVDYAVTKVEDLPKCTQSNIELGSGDVFTLECRPADLSLTEIKDQMTEELSSNDFLGSLRLTEEDLQNNTGESIEESLFFLPDLYSFGKVSMAVSVLSLSLIFILYVISRLPLMRGLDSLGRRLLSSGLVVLAIAIGFKYLLPYLTKSDGNAKDALSDLAIKVGSAFIEKLDMLTIIGFGIIAAVGAALVITLFFVKRSENYKLKTHEKSMNRPKKNPEALSEVSDSNKKNTPENIHNESEDTPTKQEP